MRPVLGLVFVCSVLPAYAQTPPSQYSRADIEYGAQIFVTQCVACHGTDGQGVPNVNLRSGQFHHATSDADLRNVITGGISGTAMRPFNFDPSELTGIIAFLRNMSTFDDRSVAIGNAARGQALFAGVGNCTSCHRVNGQGPRVAPDLSDVGATHTADQIQRSLLDPNAAMLPMNRSIRAVTRDGKVITGRRLNEDTYSVQLIDGHERLVSLIKSDLREYSVIKTSSMPSYKDKLDSQQLANLVAYLLSLKGLK